MSWLPPALVLRLGWTLLHFLWQGAALAGVLALLLWLAKGRSPRLRYGLAYLMLVLMAAAPAVTWYELGRPAVVWQAPVAAAATGNSEGRIAAPSAAAAPANVVVSTRTAWSGWLPMGVGLWLLGVAVMSLRLASGWAWLQWLRRRPATVPAADDIQLRLLRLCQRMNLASNIRILLCEKVPGPTVLGWLRPVILLPPAALLGMPPDQLELVLAHELAHILRHDFAINLLQSCVEVLLFYHPAVWWVSAKIRQERELCCDDLAVRTTGDALDYAAALTRLEALCRPPDPPRHAVQALALGATGGSFMHRIRRLVSPMSPTPLAPRAGLVLLLLISGAFTLYAREASGARGAKSTREQTATGGLKGWPGFVLDPELLGGWRTVDFVQRVEDFHPGSRQFKDSDYIKEAFFWGDGIGQYTDFNGRVSPWQWSQGKVLAGSPTEGAYEIHQRAGRTFLFFQWMNDDVLFRGEKPHWVVLEKAPDLRSPEKIAAPWVNRLFQDDPAVIGQWQSVDLVGRIEAFKPDAPQHQAESPLQKLAFLPEGKTSAAYRWTKGLLLHDGSNAASRYEFREIGGAHYLFLEWESGFMPWDRPGYVHHGRTPWYCVLRRLARMDSVGSRELLIRRFNEPSPDGLAKAGQVSFIGPNVPPSFGLKALDELEALPRGEAITEIHLPIPPGDEEKDTTFGYNFPAVDLSLLRQILEGVRREKTLTVESCPRYGVIIRRRNAGTQRLSPLPESSHLSVVANEADIELVNEALSELTDLKPTPFLYQRVTKVGSGPVSKERQVTIQLDDTDPSDFRVMLDDDRVKRKTIK